MQLWRGLGGDSELTGCVVLKGVAFMNGLGQYVIIDFEQKRAG
jgi:hypothetical protein